MRDYCGFESDYGATRGGGGGGGYGCFFGQNFVGHCVRGADVEEGEGGGLGG